MAGGHSGGGHMAGGHSGGGHIAGGHSGGGHMAGGHSGGAKCKRSGSCRQELRRGTISQKSI